MIEALATAAGIITGILIIIAIILGSMLVSIRDLLKSIDKKI